MEEDRTSPRRETPDLYAIAEAAKKLRVSESTVRREIADGLLAAL